MTVFKEMETVTKSVISKSYADSSYPKAIKALQAYRSEAIAVVLLVIFADVSLMNLCISTNIFNRLRKNYLLGN